jgi:hypothetical protein
MRLEQAILLCCMSLLTEAKAVESCAIAPQIAQSMQGIAQHPQETV